MQRQEDAEFGRAKSTSPPQGSETSPVSHKGFVTLGVKVMKGFPRDVGCASKP